ncbi:NUDIX hydrolase [Mobilicoccus pelagius]|uniref:Putative hydrolase n=1 Tax=Mobilicoccus pelagius NBRC 104925 TaxID=1089455 RepID=H5UP92_9MICO|nr:CoA pyrophosphatase [Mobilicoccus pelagius]GAB47550.1 putative hydrolase [Mobilicoccus pelagius NBRC 104925]
MTPRPAWLDHAAQEAGRAPHGFFTHGRVAGGGRRRSAVLLLVGPGEAPGEETVVLTERSGRLRSHAGQVSFPGGAIDPGDGGPVDAALREAGEEIGLDRAGVDVLTTFPPVPVPASDSSVTTVLAWWSNPSPITVTSPVEVARILTIPLARFADPAHRITVTHPVGYHGVGFELDGVFVWGFTAAMLDRLLVLTGLARPWDAAVTRVLPDRVSGGRPPVVMPPAPASEGDADPATPAGTEVCGDDVV